VLEQSTPANDAVIQTSPREVTLRFSEPVTVQPDAIRVFDANGGRVDSGPVTKPASNAVATKLRPDLADGTYTVAWRAVSADSHPVFGAFVFHVGAPGANPEGIGAQVLQAEETPKTVSVTFTAVRFFSFALVLLCAGGTALLALALGAAGDRLRGRLLGTIAGLAVALCIVSLFGIVLQGASAQAFGLGQAFRWSVVDPVLDTRFGQVWLARAGVALLLAGAVLWLRRGRGPDWLLDAALVLCVGLVLSPAASGHASVGGAAAFVADVVHVQAAAVWVGGLAFLGLALLLAGDGRWTLARSAVPRFSTMAVVAVAALLVAGVVNGYLEVRSWSGLWNTTFGNLVLVKAGLVLPLLALGLYNNRVSVPRLKAGADSASGRRFLYSVGGELAIMVAIVAVTSVLVGEPPAKALAERGGPYATVVDIGQLEANVVVDPARAGTNAIHIYLMKKTGQPADVAEVDVYASLASAGIEPIHYDAKRLARGHYAVYGAQLSPPGDWQLRIEARRGEFQLDVQTVSVPVESP
jgi:copper transport protein